MNLKEAFRYQNLLERLMKEATTALSTQANLLKVTKLHLRSKVKPEAQDETEEADETDLMDPDLVIAFMKRVITEREQLTTAIGLAKRNLHGSVADLDAAVEANKYRQTAANHIKSMLRMRDGKRTERGTSYNFNAEGTQVPYVYNIEVSSEVRFDRAAAKKIMQELLAKADKVSAAIDDAMVNTLVAYDAPWDVNESFEDIIAGFRDKGAGGNHPRLGKGQ